MRYLVPAIDDVFPRLARFLALTTLFFMLAGCQSPQLYSNDRKNPPVYHGVHTVKPGETLYSIAWRYGRNYKELALTNSIGPPYKIFPGQKIDLARSAPKPSSKPPARASKPAAKPKSLSTQPRAETRSKKASSGLPKWRWPSRGKVIATFSTGKNLNKGIDIAGKLGDPVMAAASGEVVYAGSGLLGYGLLIIVNHNDDFLSAYAHNNKILVKQGDRVRAGQKIAELGSSGTDRPKLHFEIRKDGKPVNPLWYLPKR